MEKDYEIGTLGLRDSGRIKLNMVMNLILTVSTAVFPLIVYPYVTRVLGPAGMGKIYLATAVTSYFSMFAQLGIPVYGVRACARVRDDRQKLSQTVAELAAVNAAACLPVYLVYAICISCNGVMAADRLLYIIIGISIGFNAINTDWLFQAVEDYSYITIRTILLKAASVLLIFMMVNSPEQYVLYGGLSILAGCGSSLINLFNLRRYVSFRGVGRMHLKTHIRTAAGFFALSAITTLYTNLDVAVLRFFCNDETVGLYGLSVKIQLMAVSCIISISAVIMPRISNLLMKDEGAGSRELLAKTFRLVMAAACAGSAFLCICSRWIVVILGGSSFGGSALSLSILALTIVPIGISNFIGMKIFVPRGRESYSIISACIGAVTDIVANIILIPILQGAGAAIGTLLAEIMVMLYILKKYRELDSDIIQGLIIK